MVLICLETLERFEGSLGVENVCTDKDKGQRVIVEVRAKRRLAYL